MAEIVMSNEVAQRLQEIVSGGSPEGAVRLYVDHECHCGGLKYGMALEQAHPDDLTLERDGVTFHLESRVADQPGQVSIEYITSLMRSGFTLTNSEHQCGGMGH